MQDIIETICSKLRIDWSLDKLQRSRNLSRIGLWVDMDEVANFLTILRKGHDTGLPDNALERLRDGSADVVLVDGVFSQDICAAMVDALEKTPALFEVTEFPGPFRSFFYGRNLNLNDPDLDDYFNAAKRFETDLLRFGACFGVDIAARLVAVLTELDRGHTFEAAPGPGFGRHFFTTFRGHRPGGYIPAHFDNEQSFRPSYRYIAEATEGDILSFVVTLAEAEAGGMLELYDLLASDLGGEHRNDDDLARKPDLSKLKSHLVHVPAGSMVIVRSGRRLHRVAPVEGSRTRWTLCSFMASAKTGGRNFCWG